MTAALHSLRVLLDGLSFPEGPRWRDGALWFSDFYTHRVQSVDLTGEVTQRATVPNRPSGLGFAPDGTLLVVSMLDRRLMAVEGDGMRVVADLSELASGPCNDMVVDRGGRAYVGNFGYDKNNGEPPRETRIIKVEPDGTAEAVGDELVFPNGMVITADGRRLIVGETFAERLSMFDIAPDGALSNRRIFAEIEGCHPDGIALDAEGAVWVADPVGKRVLRVVEGGAIRHEVPLGERGAYACMLGGPGRRTLFVLTNSGSGPAMANRRDGRVEVVEVEVPGAGLP
ncbi:MAG TPA: SMP-30/gluconolactonase/LRE family protein [Geminicoccaceae bacterium]|nr:SMP-30/gluconolactonase/LRE family protein [Geminicoccaceae bacterium]